MSTDDVQSEGEIVLADGRALQMPDVEDMTDADRPYWGYKLRLAGWDWDQVAQAVGYSDRVSAAMSVKAYLQRAARQVAAEQRSEVMQLENDRTEALIKAYWAKALAGDLKAADFCLKVINAQIK